MGKMKLRDLRYFAVAAREGSFEQAARKLGTTQGTVSKHVKASVRERGRAFRAYLM